MDRALPRIAIREATGNDAQDIAALLAELGYPTTPEAFGRRFVRLAREPATWLFVPDAGGRVVGLAGLRVSMLVERDEPVGRLIALVVSGPFRGGDIGRRSSAPSRRPPGGGLRAARPQLERPARRRPRLLPAARVRGRLAPVRQGLTARAR
jgi:hypothetical protein